MKVKNVLILICVLFFNILLSSCEEVDNQIDKKKDTEENMISEVINSDDLSEETDLRIRQTYFDKLYSEVGNTEVTIDDIKILHYLGTYHDSIAIVFKGEATAKFERQIKIGEIEFLYKYELIIIWNDDDLYTLREAFNLGLITNEDLGLLFVNYQKVFLLENINRGDLCEEKKLKIRQTYLDKLYSESLETKATIDDIEILYYLGTYNNSIAIVIKGDAMAIPERRIKIGDIEFQYKYESIAIWNDNHIYALKEAFDLGLINKQNLEQLYVIYEKVVLYVSE